MREQALNQLAEYGYTLTPENRIAKGDKVLGLKVLFKRDRMRVEMYPTEHKVFTGVNLGVFVKGFFYAEKVK